MAQKATLKKKKNPWSSSRVYPMDHLKSLIYKMLNLSQLNILHADSLAEFFFLCQKPFNTTPHH